MKADVVVLWFNLLLAALQIWSKYLAPSAYVGDLDGILCFWCQLGLALAITVIWGVNQGVEDIALFSLSLSLFFPLFQHPTTPLLYLSNK